MIGVSSEPVKVGSPAKLRCVFGGDNVIYVTWTKIQLNGSRVFVYEHNLCSETSRGYNDLEGRSTVIIKRTQTNDVPVSSATAKDATPDLGERGMFAPQNNVIIQSNIGAVKYTVSSLSIQDANVDDEGEYECAVKLAQEPLVWASSVLSIYGKNRPLLFFYCIP